ncbi:MAG TPA: hypothetical protein VI980_08200 [Acidimicrobiia bacterium]|nr:hypothetical protein [Acidimicrobiia bacterium]
MIRRPAALLALLLVVASCTPGPDSPSGTDPLPTSTTAPTTTSTTTTTEAAVEAFRTCLGEHDVVIEEVPLDATGRPRLDLVVVSVDFGDPAVAGALAVCSESLNTGALDLGAEDELRQEITRQLNEFSQCMRANGVEDFPDPVPGFAGVGAPFAVAEIPYGDPEMAEAAEACRASILGTLPGLDES